MAYELIEAVKVLRADNEKLAKDLEEALAGKADAEKLNGLLVRKYRDGEERARAEKQIDADAQKIIKGQEELGRLLRQRLAAEERRAYRKIKNQVEGVSPPPAADAAGASDPVKRKRGRPRKDASLPAATMESAVRKAVFVPSPSPYTAQDPIKRKRGRPRKDAPETNPDVESAVRKAVASPAAAESPARKRGRPRRVIADDPALPAPVAETTVRKAVFVPTPKEGAQPAKRKRGRPRKDSAPVVEAAPRTIESRRGERDDADAEAKRRRSFSKLINIE